MELFLFGDNIDLSVEDLIFDLMGFHLEQLSLPEAVFIRKQNISLFRLTFAQVILFELL